MLAPPGFSNFAALAYCLKALAWVCTVASFQLQTYSLHRFSLGFSWMSATALTLEGEERLISKFKQCLCSRKMSITNEHIHYITCQILHMLRYHEKLFQAYFKIIPINLLRACDDCLEKTLANCIVPDCKSTVSPFSSAYSFHNWSIFSFTSLQSQENPSDRST